MPKKNRFTALSCLYIQLQTDQLKNYINKRGENKLSQWSSPILRVLSVIEIHLIILGSSPCLLISQRKMHIECEFMHCQSQRSQYVGIITYYPQGIFFRLPAYLLLGRRPQGNVLGYYLSFYFRDTLINESNQYHGIFIYRETPLLDSDISHH